MPTNQQKVTEMNNTDDIMESTSINDLINLLSKENEHKSTDNNKSELYDKRLETILALMPFLNEKTRKTADIIIASIKISKIISELKEKYQIHQ